MSSSNETNEQSCLSPLDSAKFIMERSKHVSIDIPALQKLSTIVFNLYFIFQSLQLNQILFRYPVQ